MTVVHIAAGLQEACGVSRYVVGTARAQQAAGHDVTIVTAMTCGCPVDGLKVVLSPSPVEPLAAVSDLRPPASVVHIHSMWSPYVHRAAAWCRARGIPYVVSPHGATTPWSMRFRRWKKIPAWWLYQRRDLAGAAAFHVTVPDEEGDVRRLGFTQPVVIAPLGADLPDPPTPSTPSAPSSRDVLFLSRIHPKKNVPALLRAWALLGHPSRARLVIAGSDGAGLQDGLVELARSLGLRVADLSRDPETRRARLADCEADVVFAGPVYGTEKDRLFARAWASVLPSHSENFGGVVVESLAQGTPVVASRGTPWRELEGDADGGRCGWWTEATPERLAAALAEALAMDPARRAEMSAAGRERVRRKYSWSASAARVLALYSRILAKEGCR